MGKVMPMQLPNATPREKWVERISAAWQESLPSIFETGSLLEAAKAELPHGQWLPMIKDDLPFKANVAQRLIKIAENDNLRNTAHAPYLPVSWMTLYELTKLTDEQFEDAIKSRAINPKMERKDVAILRGIEPKERKKKETGEPETSDECVARVKKTVLATMQKIASSEWKSLLRQLRAEIDNIDIEQVT